MEIAKIRVYGTFAKVLKRTDVPAGLVGGSIRVEFSDPLWDDLDKLVVFKGAVTKDVITDGGVVNIPREVLDTPNKRFQVGFYGTDASSEVVIPTFWADLGIIRPATDPSEDTSTDPGLPVWAQIMERVEDLEEKVEAITSGDIPAGPEESAGSAVLYDPQDLTDSQKEQARKNIGAASVIIADASGETIILTDSIEAPFNVKKLYGKTIQNGTPSPEAPVDLVNAGANGDILVRVGTSEDDSAPQTFSIPTPNGLPGIPVASGGNYTDENGQQWVCDEVDLERGVYVQRIYRTVFNSSAGWSLAGTSSGLKRFYTNQFMGVIKNAKDDATKGLVLCSNFPNVTPADTWYEVTGISLNNKGRLDIYYSGIEQTTAALGEYLASNPATFMAEIATPIERPLSDEELADYAIVHTHYPNTTIFNDDGVGMEIAYMADTKRYIDKKFAQLAAAML